MQYRDKTLSDIFRECVSPAAQAETNFARRIETAKTREGILSSDNTFGDALSMMGDVKLSDMSADKISMAYGMLLRDKVTSRDALDPFFEPLTETFRSAVYRNQYDRDSLHSMMMRFGRVLNEGHLSPGQHAQVKDVVNLLAIRMFSRGRR